MCFQNLNPVMLVERKNIFFIWQSQLLTLHMKRSWGRHLILWLFRWSFPLLGCRFLHVIFHHGYRIRSRNRWTWFSCKHKFYKCYSRTVKFKDNSTVQTIKHNRKHTSKDTNNILTQEKTYISCNVRYKPLLTHQHLTQWKPRYREAKKLLSGHP